MTQSHAEVARRLTMTMKPGVFAHAAQDAVIHQDFTTIERLFPGVKFMAKIVGLDLWELSGVCADGSTVYWKVGG